MSVLSSDILLELRMRHGIASMEADKLGECLAGIVRVDWREEVVKEGIGDARFAFYVCNNLGRWRHERKDGLIVARSTEYDGRAWGGNVNICVEIR